MTRRYLADFFSAPLIFLFAYTAISKLMDITEFSGAMHNQPFPSWLASAFTWIVPVSELMVCAALLFTSTRRKGLYGSLVLMLLFTGYTAAILLNFFPRIPCSCGGVIRQLTWTQHLLFNIFFLLLSAAGIFFHVHETGETENLHKRVSNISH